MKKSKTVFSTEEAISVAGLKSKLELLTGSFTIGPGTVPTSGASVSQTSIKEMTSLLRKASRKGIFEVKENDKYGYLQGLAE